jgi:hypothetical protein
VSAYVLKHDKHERGNSRVSDNKSITVAARTCSADHIPKIYTHYRPCWSGSLLASRCATGGQPTFAGAPGMPWCLACRTSLAGAECLCWLPITLYTYVQTSCPLAGVRLQGCMMMERLVATPVRESSGGYLDIKARNLHPGACCAQARAVGCGLLSSITTWRTKTHKDTDNFRYIA